eukprot:scaffold113182_cov19-Tisochrysis_lutea.AAC.1
MHVSRLREPLRNEVVQGQPQLSRGERLHAAWLDQAGQPQAQLHPSRGERAINMPGLPMLEYRSMRMTGLCAPMRALTRTEEHTPA